MSLPQQVALWVTLAVAGASVTILQLGDARARAGRDDVTGFLALDRAGGMAYDVAADPARYLITGKDHEWSTDAAVEEPQIENVTTAPATNPVAVNVTDDPTLVVGVGVVNNGVLGG